MAADYFLNIDGVSGESHTIKDAMEITTFDWGCSQPGSSSSGSGAGTGKVKMDDFNFTLTANKSTPQLMLLCAQGTPCKTAKLQCRKAGGKQQTYFIADFKDVLISSYKTSGPGGDESNPVDTISFNYTGIEISYYEQDAKGGVSLSAKKKFDVKTGTGG